MIFSSTKYGIAFSIPLWAGVSGWAWQIWMLIFPSVLVIIGGALIYKTHYLGSVFMWIGGLMLVIGYLSGASLFGIMFIYGGIMGNLKRVGQPLILRVRRVAACCCCDGQHGVPLSLP